MSDDNSSREAPANNTNPSNTPTNPQNESGSTGTHAPASTTPSNSQAQPAVNANPANTQQPPSNDGSSSVDQTPKRSRDEDEEKRSKKRAKIHKGIIEKMYERQEDRASRHKPYTRKGTIFLWKDNQHVKNDGENRAAVGTEDKNKTTLRLKDSTGKVTNYYYPRATTINWNEKKEIAKLYKWRSQLIQRKLNAKDGPKASRHHWSDREKRALAQITRGYIRKVRRELTSDDWTKVARKFNKKFDGTQFKAGEKLAAAKNPEDKSKPTTLKKDHTFVPRSISAIKTQATRFAEVRAGMQAEVDRINRQEAAVGGGLKAGMNEGGGETGEDGESSSSEDDDDSVLDWDSTDDGFESESSDEDDGNRPVGERSGARLIPA